MTSNKTPTTSTASPVKEWEDVDIYWSNDKLDDFNTVYALPKVKRHSDATTLNHDVSFTPYEPSKVNDQGVKDIAQLLKEQKDFEKAIAEAQKDTFELVCIDASEEASPMDYKQYCTMENQKAVANRETGKQIRHKRVGLIADAVTQSIICKVVLKTEPQSAKDLPNITTWAFLQPPTIGSNKRRVNANNGYVVDDAQKSGWFLGKISNSDAQPNGDNQYTSQLIFNRTVKDKSGKPSGKKPEKIPVNIKVDGKEIFYKFTVIVRNDESEEDFKNKREMLGKKGSMHDVLTLECGSYIKIWVRNSDFSWRDSGPVDEYTEKLREDMDSVDLLTDSNKPQSAKNHTWKRNSIVSGEKDKELIYIGLYPTTLIKKINELEELVQPIQPTPKKTNFATWLAVTIAYAFLNYHLNEARNASAKNAKSKGSSKTEQELEHEFGQKYYKILAALNVPQIAAAYAVAGFNHKTNVNKTLGEIKNAEYESLFKTTSYIYGQLLDFSLGKSDEGEKKHIESIKEENKKTATRILAKELGATTSDLLAAQTKTPENLKSAVTDFAKSAKADDGGALKGSLTLDAAALNIARTLPATPRPLPIPFLQWIAWYILCEIKANLSVTLTGEYCYKEDAKTNSPTEDIAKLTAALKGSGSASLTFNLQAIWTALIDKATGKVDTDAIRNPKSPFESYRWGQLLKDIFEVAEVHLYVGAKIETSLEGSSELSYDFTKDASKAFGCTPGVNGGLSFSAPLGCQISVFSWSYNLAKVNILDVTQKQASLFSYMQLLENVFQNDPVIIRWGDGLISQLCYLRDEKGQFKFGDNIEVYLPYAAVKDAKFTAGIGYRVNPNTFDIITFSDTEVTTNSANKRIGDEDFTDEAVISGRFLIHSDNPRPGDFVISDKGSKSKEFLNYIKGKSEVALDHIHFDEDGKIEMRSALFDGHSATLKLPELKSHSVIQQPSATQKTIRFELQFHNMGGEYIYARLAELEKTIDRNFKYKLPGNNEYLEWNRVKLKKVGNSYTLDIDLTRVEGLKDEWTWDETGGQLQFYLEFAFYADNNKNEYVIKQDTSAKSYALVDGDIIDAL